MKKLLSVILSLVLVFSVLPLSVFSITASAATSGYYTYTVLNGKATITDCDTSVSGSLTIPSTLGGYPVTSIGDWAFDNCSSLTSITIPDSVTSIGWSAFEDCSSLTSITIGDSVESLGKHAFYNCSSLESIKVDINNKKYHSSGNCIIETSRKTLIAGCKNSVIPLDGSLTSIGEYAFYGCSSLATVTIPESVTSIGYMAFYGCSSLTTITIPESVTSIGDSAFYNCSSLTSITIPDSVTNIGYGAFYKCSSIKTVYYCGTGKDWNKISIGSENLYLTKATRYYHNFGDWHIRTELNCETDGEKYRVCSICGKEETEIVSATGHNFSDWQVRTEADCETNGEKYRVCSACGDEETEIIPALGHAFAEDFTIDKEPTYFEEGSKSKHCSRCDSVAEVTPIPKTSLADGVCGENAKWALKENGVLLIAGSGATSNYKYPNYAPWYEYSAAITEIIIESEITKIGNSNFAEFENLNKVSVENPDCVFGLYVFPEDTSKITLYSCGGGATENYAKTNGIKFTKPENPNTPLKPVLKYRTETSVELYAVEGYEYTKDGINWQNSPLFQNLVSGVSYSFYQRIADGVYSPSSKSEPITVTTLTKPNAPTVEKVEGNTVTLKYEEGIEYSIDGINWQCSNVFCNVTFDSIINFYARKEATATDGATSASEPKKCIIASAPKVLVGETCIKVVPNDNYEYCIDNMVWQDSNVFTRYIYTEETYIVFQRPKTISGVEIFYDTEGTTVVVNGNDAIETPDATHLVWLKKLLLESENCNNLAADFNGDYSIDIRDLVRLKKMLAEINLPKDANIYLSNESLAVGENLTVDLVFNAKEPIYAVSSVIQYNSNVLEYVSGNASGGSGSLKLVESPYGETKVSYRLTFKAIAEGTSAIDVSECQYATSGDYGAVQKELNGTSKTVNISN